MTDDTMTGALEGLRIRLRELELEAVDVRARVAEVRTLIEHLENPRRRRARKLQAVETQPEPDNGEAA